MTRFGPALASRAADCSQGNGLVSFVCMKMSSSFGASRQMTGTDRTVPSTEIQCRIDSPGPRLVKAHTVRPTATTLDRKRSKLVRSEAAIVTLSGSAEARA